MAVYSLIDLIASITAKVFQNSNKSVSGAQLQAALIDIAQSSVNKTTDAALLGGGLKDYVTNRVYLAGEGCFQLGKTYRANKGTTGAFNAADWDLSIVGKADVGLGNADNTSDLGKPVSTAQGVAIALKEDSSNKSNDILDSASTTKFPVWAAILAYFTGARIRTLLGISTLSGSNTGDQDLSGLQATLVSATNIKTINGGSILGSGNIVVASGGGGTSDGYSVGAELYLFNNFT